MVFAVYVGATATPDAPVVTVDEAEKVPLAPEPGGVKVTLAPTTGLLKESRTKACSAVVKAVFTVLLCGVPALVTMEAAAPARWVRLNVGAEAMPGIAVVTE